jgi:hypothetical protein
MVPAYDGYRCKYSRQSPNQAVILGTGISRPNRRAVSIRHGIVSRSACVIAGQSKSPMSRRSGRHGHHRVGGYVPSSNHLRFARPKDSANHMPSWRRSRTIPSGVQGDGGSEPVGRLTRSLRKKYSLDHHPYCFNDYILSRRNWIRVRKPRSQLFSIAGVGTNRSWWRTLWERLWGR